MRLRPAGVMVLAACVLTGCAAPEHREVLPSPTPVAVATGAELVAQRRAAGIEDCPTSDPSATGTFAITLECIGGDSRVNLAGIDRSTPAIINVWAQWCGPCRAEAPILAEVAGRVGDKATFLGIDYADPHPDWAIEFARESGQRYPQLADPEQESRVALHIIGAPTTLFITTSGELVVAKAGPWESASEFTAAISQHLGVNV